jgi:hypothetical protein
LKHDCWKLTNFFFTRAINEQKDKNPFATLLAQDLERFDHRNFNVFILRSIWALLHLQEEYMQSAGLAVAATPVTDSIKAEVSIYLYPITVLTLKSLCIFLTDVALA